MRFFQHSQHGEVYAVSEVVASQETGEQFVVYTVTSDPEAKSYVVPMAMFFGEIELDGKLVPRVVPIDQPEEPSIPLLGEKKKLSKE